MLVCLCAGVAYLNLRSHQGSSCSQDINYTCCHDLYVGMGRRQEEGREREREIVDELGAKEKSAQFA